MSFKNIKPLVPERIRNTMKTYLQTCLVISILGIFTTPAASMEKISVTNTATSLEGVMSLNIASGLTPVETDIRLLDRIPSINVSTEATSSLLETDANPESALSLTTENVGEPSTNPVVFPLIQF